MKVAHGRPKVGEACKVEIEQCGNPDGIIPTRLLGWISLKPARVVFECMVESFASPKEIAPEGRSEPQ